MITYAKHFLAGHPFEELVLAVVEGNDDELLFEVIILIDDAFHGTDTAKEGLGVEQSEFVLACLALLRRPLVRMQFVELKR